MGVASYARGNRGISLQFRMDAYALDHSRPDPNAPAAPVVPRSADWGSKAMARAIRVAEGIARRNAEYPRYAIDFDQAVEVVINRVHCGRDTAVKAVESSGIGRPA